MRRARIFFAGALFGASALAAILFAEMTTYYHEEMRE